jgi:hypothetical protein
MNTLIIHPEEEDFSTSFLKQIYKDIPCCRVITKHLPKDELIDAILKAQNVLLLGHGDKNGLFSNSKYIIDSDLGKLLESKNCILIFCHAKDFLINNKLNINSIASQMFISEISELICLDESFEFEEEIEAYQPMIDHSNKEFSVILGNLLKENSFDDLPLIYEKLKHEYGAVGKRNEVVAYNNERLYLSLVK